MNHNYSIILFFILSFIGLGQNTQVGEWRMHLSYSKINTIIESNNLVFAGTESGLFSYNRDDQSLQRFSKLTGLSSTNISALGYDDTNKTLIIGYVDGNIDIMKNHQIINIPYIEMANILGGKSINHIFIDNQFGYISCAFGLVILNLENYEVQETCYFVTNGSNNQVFSTYVFNDIISAPSDSFLANKIFAATANGLYYANKMANLTNYNVWQNDSRISFENGNDNLTMPIEGVSVIHVKGFDLQDKGGKRLIIGTDIDYTNFSIPWSGVSKFNFFEFNTTAYIESSLSLNLFQVNSGVPGEIIDINYNANHVAVITNDNFTEKLIVLEGCGQDCFDPLSLNSILSINSNSVKKNTEFYFSCVMLPENYNQSKTVFLGDQRLGLVSAKHQNYKLSNVKYVFPDGPAGTGGGAIIKNGNSLMLTHGGKAGSWNNTYNYQEISLLKNSNWSQSNQLIQMGVYDVVSGCKVPQSEGGFFIGTWNNGLYELSDSDVVMHYNEKNSALQTISKEGWIRIGGVDSDNSNALWMTNSQAEKPLIKFKNGIWESFSVPGLSTATMIGKILCTSNGQKWIQLRNEGVMVAIENGDNILSKKLGISNGLESLSINCFSEDNKGAVWVGSSNGLSVCYFTETIFNNEPYTADYILIETSDGYVEKLFENTEILDIAVDAANRKWIGTKNNGAFLVSEDGTEQIHHFTKQNSPLLDNNVSNICILDNTGEVFFVTKTGVCSYRSNATKSNNSFNNVAIFPNPVRRSFNGHISIAGLRDNTSVKITDISGNLVFECISLGGMATWDGRGKNGKRVSTGVYLFLCTDELFQESVVKKVLIYN